MKKLVIFLIVVAVLAVALLSGVFAAKEKNAAPTAAPVTPATTPAAPTVAPVALTAEELIASANKLRYGDTVKVSGVVVESGITQLTLQPGQIYLQYNIREEGVVLTGNRITATCSFLMRNDKGVVSLTDCSIKRDP